MVIKSESNKKHGHDTNMAAHVLHSHIINFTFVRHDTDIPQISNILTPLVSFTGSKLAAALRRDLLADLVSFTGSKLAAALRRDLLTDGRGPTWSNPDGCGPWPSILNHFATSLHPSASLLIVLDGVLCHTSLFI